MPDALLQSSNSLQCLIDLLGKRAAMRRQFQPSRQAIEQAYAKLFLQATDAVADRALCKVQLVGCLGEAEVARGHGEDAQCIEGRCAGHGTTVGLDARTVGGKAGGFGHEFQTGARQKLLSPARGLSGPND